MRKSLDDWLKIMGSYSAAVATTYTTETDNRLRCSRITLRSAVEPRWRDHDRQASAGIVQGQGLSYSDTGAFVQRIPCLRIRYFRH